ADVGRTLKERQGLDRRWRAVEWDRPDAVTGDLIPLLACYLPGVGAGFLVRDYVHVDDRLNQPVVGVVRGEANCAVYASRFKTARIEGQREKKWLIGEHADRWIDLNRGIAAGDGCGEAYGVDSIVPDFERPF